MGETAIGDRIKIAMIQFDNAIKRYSDLILKELKEAGITCWLAGGALRDYFMGVKIMTDYDLFFPDSESYEKCKKHFQSKGGEVKWESENGMKVVYGGKSFDLVKKYFTDPQATIDAFDFTVSMFAVDSERIYHGETTFIDLAKRQLMINKITYPASTLSRAFRYYKKGFAMCRGEMKKIVEAIQDMPKEEQPEQDNDNEGSGNGFWSGID